MKKTVFIAHDPGGYDVIFPVYIKFKTAGIAAELYCLGPAAAIQSQCKLTQSELLVMLELLIADDVLQMLVTGTSWGSDVEITAIRLCKDAGVFSVSILDYWSNYAQRFKDKSGSYIYPDIFIVMDELAREEAIEEGVPQEIIKELGHPGLDSFVQSGHHEKINNNPFHRVLFLSQPVSLLYGERLGYTERSVLQDCIEVVDSVKEIKLYIKFHPKDDSAFQDQYRDISVEGSLNHLFWEFDLIIGMSTMGLLHAVLAGVPAISYQPQLIGNDLCIASKLQLIPSVLKKELLGGAVKQALSGCNLESNKSKLEDDSLIWLDGRSTERVFQYLAGVVK